MMKRMSLVLAFILMMLSSTVVFANDGFVSQDGIEATIITDKEEFDIGDEVTVSLKLSNTNDYVVENVKYKIVLPKGLSASKDSVLEGEIASLEANQDMTISVSATAIETTTNVDTGDSTNYKIFIVLIIASASLAGFLLYKKKITIKSIAPFSVLLVIATALTVMNINAAVVSKSFEVSKTIKLDGEDKNITATITYNGEGEEETTTTPLVPDGEDNDNEEPGEGIPEDIEVSYKRVSVHDPSIVKDHVTGKYYIFGSHMAWAKSTNLSDWEVFTNNINTNYTTVFAEGIAWARRGDNGYNPSGNMWAPDVIYNEQMGKWCMYMSVNGIDWHSSIALATADNIEGPYTFVDTVIYSGFNNGVNDVALTDFEEVTGSTDISRYLDAQGRWNHRYGAHAIDPNINFDDDGKMWMVYGSWSGGIYIIELDPETGLRKESTTYPLVANGSDPYMGIKLGGAYQSSGEAPYIEKIGDYYYLFITNGGLFANGGYSMRLFRSESITGPYTDPSGDDARRTSATNNTNGTLGVKVMSYYKWWTWDYAHVAQGHNSILTDDDGRVYNVYHTRTNDGSEGHQVRVHQMLVNEDGWLLAAPFEFEKEKVSQDGYELSEIIGEYELLEHTQSINYTALEYSSPKKVVLNADYTVSGEYTGTWSYTQGSAYITLSNGATTYKGVLMVQKVENETRYAMTFTALGSNELVIWGAKFPTDEEAVNIAKNDLIIPSAAITNLTLPSSSYYDTTITWTSSNTSVLANDGTLTPETQDVSVNLTATITKNQTTTTKVQKVNVLGRSEDPDAPILVGRYYTNAPQSLDAAINGTFRFPNPFNKNVTSGLKIYNGVIIKFDVERTGNFEYLSNIIGFNNTTEGRLYFTGGSYLGYNATGEFVDANVNTDPWGPGIDLIGNAKTTAIEIKLLPTGFEVWADDILRYTNESITDKDIYGNQDSLTSYASILSFLNNSATQLNFGAGSWWTDGFKGTISNVELYANPVEPDEDTSGYTYYQNYNDITLASDFWISTNFQAGVLLRNDGNAMREYISFEPGESNSRGAYSFFNIESTNYYDLEFDVSLKAGNDQTTEFVVLGTDSSYLSNNVNDGIDNGYILKLASTNSTTWSINNNQGSVVLPQDWVNVKLEVRGSNARLVITNRTTNAIILEQDINTSTQGTLKGLYIRGGRRYSVTKVDNVKVIVNDVE